MMGGGGLTCAQRVLVLVEEARAAVLHRSRIVQDDEVPGRAGSDAKVGVAAERLAQLVAERLVGGLGELALVVQHGQDAQTL